MSARTSSRSIRPTRRQVLAAAGAVTAAGLLPRPARATPVPGSSRVPLAVPPIVDGSSPVAVSVTSATHDFSAALSNVPTLCYRLDRGQVLVDGSPHAAGYLGPVIAARTGTPTRLTVTNAAGAHPLASSIDTMVMGARDSDRSAPRSAVHLHGGNTRLRHDGGPLDTFDVGSSRSYVYDNPQDATALWYHDHAYGITRLNVYAGLAAGYLVRDLPWTGIDTGDGRWLPAGPYEIPLLLQDRTFTPDGHLFYDEDWVPEFFGDTAVVNGVVDPFLDVDRGVYRFRVYNGCNARFLHLSLDVAGSSRRLPFWQVGSDGGLLNAAVRHADLLLAPAERADLLVDFSLLPAGTTVRLANDAVVPFPSGPLTVEDGAIPLPTLLEFRVGSRRGWRCRTPLHALTLRPFSRVERLDRLAARARVRTHSLVEIANTDGDVTVVTLDNRPFLSDDYTAAPVRANEVTVWEIVNTTMDTHPIHLHLVQFQVLDRQPFDAAAYRSTYYADSSGSVTFGSGPYPAPPPTGFLTGRRVAPARHESGWKDTVQAPPGMVTRIAVPLGHVPGVRTAAPFVETGDYVWHCHILEHEENDMMQRYRITG